MFEPYRVYLPTLPGSIITKLAVDDDGEERAADDSSGDAVRSPVG